MNTKPIPDHITIAVTDLPVTLAEILWRHAEKFDIDSKQHVKRLIGNDKAISVNGDKITDLNYQFTSLPPQGVYIMRGKRPNWRICLQQAYCDDIETPVPLNRWNDSYSGDQWQMIDRDAEKISKECSGMQDTD